MPRSLMDFLVAVAVVAVLFRPLMAWAWVRQARRAGMPTVDLATLRAEHAQQILAEAATDPDLDVALRVVEAAIIRQHAGRWGWWQPRFIRRLALGTLAAYEVCCATEPGQRQPPGYMRYSHTRLVVAAAVRLAER